jgi:hypothetical protein
MDIYPGCGTANSVYLANTTLYNGVPITGSRDRSQSHVTGKSKLRKITWRGGQIEFKTTTIRQDMTSTNSYMLDSIVVSGPQGTRIKSIQMEYAYVNGRYYRIH